MVKNPNLKQRAELVEKHKIRDIHDRSAGWSDTPFEEWFRQIDDLCDVRFRRYKDKADREVTTDPWRAAIWSEAEKIACIAAEDLVDGGCREPTWRAHLEHRIFARFENETTCTNCDGRFWRSEIEPAILGDTSVYTDLQTQRQTRTPCECPPADRESGRNGLSRMFSYRADQGMSHHRDIAEDIPNEERPDRVVGLSLTNGLQSLLSNSDISEGPNPSLSPFKTTQPRHRPPLLPFLVMESKVEAIRDDAIFLQSAFVISSLLRLQQSLKTTNGNNSKWCTGPLVWYLSHRGPLWQLSAGIHQNSEYQVICLWNGKITLKDHALRLLLIVDFIVDWARDIYRQDVLMELEIAARGRRHSVSLGPDFDRLGLQYPSPPPVDVTAAVSNHPALDVRSSALRLFDTTTFAYRDASYMCHELCGICITSEDVDDVLLSAGHAQEAEIQASRILQCLTQTPYCLTTEDLRTIEEMWTGKTEFHAVLCSQSNTFWVNFAFQSTLYVRHDRFQDRPWEQLHLLTYVAVANDAISKLKLASGDRGKHINVPGSSDTDLKPSLQQILQCIERRRSSPVSECLSRAIRSETCVPAKISSQADSGRGDSVFSGIFGQFSPDVVYMTRETADVLILPLSVYEAHRVGFKEPRESWIHRLQQCSLQGPAPNSPTVFTFSSTVRSDATAVVVEMQAQDSTTSSACFLLKLPYDNSKSGISLSQSFAIDTPPPPGVFRSQNEKVVPGRPPYISINQALGPRLKSYEDILDLNPCDHSDDVDVTERSTKIWQNATHWKSVLRNDTAIKEWSSEAQQDWLAEVMTSVSNLNLSTLTRDLRDFCRRRSGQAVDDTEVSVAEDDIGLVIVDDQNWREQDLAYEDVAHERNEADAQCQQSVERNQTDRDQETELSVLAEESDANRASGDDRTSIGDETSNDEHSDEEQSGAGEAPDQDVRSQETYLDEQVGYHCHSDIENNDENDNKDDNNERFEHQENSGNEKEDVDDNEDRDEDDDGGGDDDGDNNEDDDEDADDDDENDFRAYYRETSHVVIEESRTARLAPLSIPYRPRSSSARIDYINQRPSQATPPRPVPSSSRYRSFPSQLGRSYRLPPAPASSPPPYERPSLIAQLGANYRVGNYNPTVPRLPVPEIDGRRRHRLSDSDVFYGYR